MDQWRKCNDRYYPYGEPTPGNRPTDNYESTYRQKPVRPGLIAYEVPDRPWVPHPGPSIDRYGPQYQPQGPAHHQPQGPSHHQPQGPTHHHPKPQGITEEDFLDPPRPGGFGEPRYWPVAYLHKEPPPFMQNQTSNRRVDTNYQNNDRMRYPNSRMMERPSNKTDSPSRIDIITKPTSTDGEYLSYEVIDSTDLPVDKNDSKAKISEDSVPSFETVDNVETDDIFNTTEAEKKVTTKVDESTEVTVTTVAGDDSLKEKKVQRRNNRHLSRDAPSHLFQTRTGYTPFPRTSFEDRVSYERRGLVAAI